MFIYLKNSIERIVRSQKNEMKNIVNELIKDVIEDDETNYRRPSFLVTNSDGTNRLITIFF